MIAKTFEWGVFYKIDVDSFSHDYKSIEKTKSKRKGGTISGISRRLDYLKQLNITSVVLSDFPSCSHIDLITSQLHNLNISLFLSINKNTLITHSLLQTPIDGFFIKHPLQAKSFVQKLKQSFQQEKKPLLIADENLHSSKEHFQENVFLKTLKYIHDHGFSYLTQEVTQLYLSFFYDGIVDYSGNLICRDYAKEKGIYKFLPEFLVGLHYNFHTLLYPSNTVLITPVFRDEKAKDATTLIARYSSPIMIEMGIELHQTKEKEPLRWSWAENKEKSKEAFYYNMKLFQTRKDTKVGVPTIFTQKEEFIID
ncbi:hypothetical protein ENUP19_0141G0022 [Entamoeba nuttalli]|uniref:Uncharacterized protein n=2 Tax=Entamoeba nuttalli TaxID=412467 RepID=K2HBR3_ENTNP|nr:hypothetical protein ENU1_102260 [Entamoeba nuttalli P19]EKE40094.1 hypothetical protein ENU1_102260 [Entamoeba nuttalli P19]|eukprot:XP_008857568.1 hypothetical protein ENU1_102260 [Entamoeba nuttalli P19]